MQSRFIDRLRDPSPIILDGGLATQLEAQGCDLDNPLWSASLLQDNPNAIKDAHSAFLSAGAECILTASYQASREGYANLGIGAADAEQLMLKSVSIARQACDEQSSDAFIAASLGPYGAMLHDGSEYTGNYDANTATVRRFHRQRIELFDAANVDVLALETVPSFDEAEILAELLCDTHTPAWVSFSCKDGAHICDGAAIADVARLFVDKPTVCAIGINCTPPQFVGSLIDNMRSATSDLALVVYPNSGERYDVANNRWNGDASASASIAAASRRWIEKGAKVVGGCCRVTPRQISVIAVVAGRREAK